MPLTDSLLMALLLVGLAMLGSSRLEGLVRWMSLQGFLVAALPLTLRGATAISAKEWGLALVTAAIKGALFPALVRRALRKTSAVREIEPYVGSNASVLIGMIALGAFFWIGARLPLPPATRNALAEPAGLFTLWTGLFLICARRKAITQVVGFVTMENGVYVLGAALVRHASGLIELGILLDVFVGVFIMAIVLFHISREFGDSDASRLDQLKDIPA